MDVAGNTPSSSTPPVIDTGHVCLVALARFHQLALDASALRQRFGRLEDTATLLRAARAIGLEAGVCTATGSTLERYTLPAIARANDGSFFVIVRLMHTGILIHDLRQPRPETVNATVLGQRWSGELIQVARRAYRGGESSQPFGLHWFFPVMMKYRHLLIEVLVASLFLQLFALLTPLFFQVVMDKVLVHRGYTTLDVLAIGIFAMLIFETVLGGIRSYLLSHTAHRIDVELGARLHHHLVSLPLAWFQSRPAGQAVARMRELDTIRHFMTGTALTLVVDLVFTSVFMAVMWYECAPLAMIVLAALPLYVLLSWCVTPELRARLEDKFRSAAENQSLLVESVTGMETIKSLALESRMQQEWEERLAQHVHGSFRAQHLNSIASQLATLVNRLVTLAIIWYGARLVMDNTISVGQLVAVNMLASRVSGPILKIAQLWHEFQQVGIAVRRLADILDTPREPCLLPGRQALPRLSGQVRFEGVSFRYRADSPRVIDALNIEVKPGEVIGIMGRSGSGKSTLGKLLQRLYVPEQGRIVLDGVDLALLDTASVRRRIGVVPQDGFLFNRSIRDNIAISDPGMSMESVIQVAKIAGAHDFILALPQGYDTAVGDRGNNLSGGQRQRIAIARALAGNPAILVFDEATSALDHESERIIQDNMAAICRGRTVFIIAHRLATLQHCNRIVVLDKGRIVEQDRKLRTGEAA